MYALSVEKKQFGETKFENVSIRITFLDESDSAWHKCSTTIFFSNWKKKKRKTRKLSLLEKNSIQEEKISTKRPYICS